jgi:cytidyltransferase-like protein
MPARSDTAGAHKSVVVSAALAGLRSTDVRLLEEAARFGSVHVRLWSDELIESVSGRPPRFPAIERRFFVANLRYVDAVTIVSSLDEAVRPIRRGVTPSTVVALRDGASNDTRRLCEVAGVPFVELDGSQLQGFAVPSEAPAASPDARRVIVTGCYDWLHSGHVEFFREASALGDLYVVVGSDRNVRLLKGEGHPLQSEDERRYMVQAVRQVHQALISTGTGWMDAEPEIASILPHAYVVNEDGDQPEKRDFCRTHGLEYIVLRRQPHRGLPRRSSTELRGF